MLVSPRGAVVGATDPEATAAFLALLDFTERRDAVLLGPAAAALYGLPGETVELLLSAPNATTGTVRIVGTPNPSPVVGAYDHGPHALDVYTTDMAASLARLSAAGHQPGPVGVVELGPLTMRQAEVKGPDGLLVVLVEANRRRPTLLDNHPGRLHSEAHSLVWTVASVDACLPFWKAAGLTVPFVAPVVHPELSVFMQLPRADVPLTMAMICDEPITPMRLEFLEFPEDEGAAFVPGSLSGGLHAAEWQTADLEATMSALPDAAFGDMATVDSALHPASRAVRGVAPGGVIFELWQQM